MNLIAQPVYAIRCLLAVAALLAALSVTGCATAPENNTGIEPTSDTTGNESDARNRARIHTELAAGYFGLGNLGVALEEVRIALQADPGYAPAYNVAGLVYASLKDNRRAEENFNRALQLSPADPDANNNFGMYLCQNKREGGTRYTRGDRSRSFEMIQRSPRAPTTIDSASRGPSG